MNKQAPSSNYWKKIGIVALVGSIAFFLCICIIVIASSSSGVSPTPTTNQDVTISRTLPATPAAPTATSRPDMLTCGLIESVLDSYRAKLTYAQFNLDGGEVDLYIKSLFGKKISFSGTVDDVVNNVFINDDSCPNRLSLSGIPETEAIALNKGSAISGYGTVSKFDTYEIIHVDVESYQLVK